MLRPIQNIFIILQSIQKNLYHSSSYPIWYHKITNQTELFSERYTLLNRRCHCSDFRRGNLYTFHTTARSTLSQEIIIRDYTNGVIPLHKGPGRISHFLFLTLCNKKYFSSNTHHQYSDFPRLRRECFSVSKLWPYLLRQR